MLIPNISLYEVLIGCINIIITITLGILVIFVSEALKIDYHFVYLCISIVFLSIFILLLSDKHIKPFFT